MQTGLSLVELATRIESLKTQKYDFIAPTSAVELLVREKPDGKGGSDKEVLLNAPFVPPAGLPVVTTDRVNYPIRPGAHEQIAARVGIPKVYYDRMLEKQPKLLANNVNTWFHAKPEKRLIRVLGGNARAFLSNSYQRIENEEIAQQALPILLNTPGIRVVSAEVTEKRLYIQAVTDRVQGEVKKGDVVQAGVVISNSETGHGSVSVSTLVWRLACLNGMILPDNKYRAAQLGRRIDDNEALYRDDTRAADDKAILLKVRDHVTAALDQLRFAEVLEKLQGITEQKIVGNPAKAIEVLGKKLGASEDETGNILRALIEGADLSRWGVLNAVTAQAHTATSYDRAVEFERDGARIIDLSPSDWKEVAEAA